MEFDLETLPKIDKHKLIGSCVRLPVQVDGVRLAGEVAALPADWWGNRAGRGGVHDRADAIFLRGYAPAEGPKPMENRPPLALMPTVRHLIEDTIPAPPMRCVLARLPPKVSIPSHADSGRYFERTIRLHIAIETNPHVIMYVEGLCFRMHPGEVWALNNCGTHGVLNDDPLRPRTHLICDFLPSPEFVELIARGECHLGLADPAVTRRFEEMHFANLTAENQG